MKTFFGAALALAIATLSQAWAADFDPVVRIGVLTDFSSVYKDNTGDGSFVAAQMAVDDFLAAHPETVLKPQLLKADHQNKTDIGLQVARQWYDQGVDVIADIANSAIALGISSLAAQDDKVVLVTSAGTTDLTGKSCNTNTLQWGFDNYSNTGVVKSLVKTGLKTWFFITADYTYGQNLEKQAQQFVEAAGGRVVGDVKHPLGTQDFSSYILTAQASGAQAIGLANAANDFTNALKQASEFGVTKTQAIAGMYMEINDLRALGPAVAGGLRFAQPFYWDENDRTRAWTKRFVARNGGRYPTASHAATYSGILDFLKVVNTIKSHDGKAIVAAIKTTPVEDDVFGASSVRIDGRRVGPMLLLTAKTPQESKFEWDVAKVTGTIPAEDGWRPLSQGGCPLAQN